MGKTQLLRNTSIVLVTLGVIFATVYFFLESRKLLEIKKDINISKKIEQNKTKRFTQVFEINKFTIFAFFEMGQ